MPTHDQIHNKQQDELVRDPSSSSEQRDDWQRDSTRRVLPASLLGADPPQVPPNQVQTVRRRQAGQLARMLGNQRFL